MSSKKVQSPPKDSKRIILNHADSLLFNRKFLPEINRLIGNVQLCHEDWIMDCDSAYLNEKEEDFEAFGKVFIHDDSITIRSKYLYYNGIEKFAELRSVVELSNDNATLYTDSLDYDRIEGKGYYFAGGTIVDSLNTLSSIYGEYVPATDESYFETDVVLQNPDYTLYTERLRYNTDTKIAYFDGPTIIVSDSGRIESSRGVYDTDNDVAILLDKSIVYNKQGAITADSLFYDRKHGFAEAFGSMILNDTINKMILEGAYGYFDEETEYAFATVYAVMKDYSREDTLHIAADTLEMITKKEEYDDNIRLLLAYHRAKVFQKDLQGLADSISYFSHDSILSMYQNPIVWSDSIQLEGDTIRAFFAADTIHHATAWYSAKAMRQLLDPELFEQTKSDSMVTFFAEETVRELQAYREVEAIYFPFQESIKRYFGVGRMKTPEAYVYFAADTVERALALGPIEGALHPIEKADENLKHLPGFTWEPQKRPLKPIDILEPLVDSLGNPLPLTHIAMSDLERFDGSLAALAAYETIDREIRASEERLREARKRRQEEVQRSRDAIPITIRRQQDEDLPYYQKIDFKAQLIKLCPYLETFVNLDNSTTIPSITIPEKLPSNDEPLKSEIK